MKKWLLIQLNWKNEDKENNLHNVQGVIRRVFDSKDKLKAYVDMLKDMRRMGEIPKDAGFMVVESDE